jgi:hypothetical protein
MRYFWDNKRVSSPRATAIKASSSGSTDRDGNQSSRRMASSLLYVKSDLLRTMSGWNRMLSIIRLIGRFTQLGCLPKRIDSSSPEKGVISAGSNPRFVPMAHIFYSTYRAQDVDRFLQRKSGCRSCWIFSRRCGDYYSLDLLITTSGSQCVSSPMHGILYA